ncbi:MAG: hypothetical protein IT320_25625 [Anaerolineae bacterium]|nr:hypothetical protein [Anaerolineae bacterium]
MTSLLIEYRTEGRQRGYGFTSSTAGYDDETLKRIWRAAMPRGNGWAEYVGVRSLKCFPLDDRRLALATVTVTDQQDESGRRGIRRAEVQVMAAEACAAYLRRHLLTYPANISRQIDRLPTTRQWGTIVGRMMPGFGKKQKQLVLTRGFADDRWQIMEGVIVKLALALQVGIRRYHGVVPFTTLALDPREEMPLVGVPEARLGSLSLESVLPI